MPKPGPVSAKDTEIEALVAKYHDDPTEELAASIQAQGTRAVRVLLRLLAGLSADTRWRDTGRNLIARIGHPKAGALLIEALRTSTQGSYSRALIEWLGALKSKQSVPLLVEIFQSNNIALRKSAAEALGNIGDPAVAMTLCEGLSHYALRGAVLTSLGQLRSLSTVPAILRILREGGLRVSVESNAYQALLNMGPLVLGPVLKEVASIPAETAAGSSWKRRLSRDFVATRIPVGGIWAQELVSLFKQNPGLREAILHCLHWRGADPMLAAGLLPHWGQLENNQRAAFVRALARTGRVRDTKIEALLLKVIKNKQFDREIRQNAVRGLGKIGSMRAAQAPQPLLQDVDTELKDLAKDAITKISQRG